MSLATRRAPCWRSRVPIRSFPAKTCQRSVVESPGERSFATEEGNQTEQSPKQVGRSQVWSVQTQTEEGQITRSFEEGVSIPRLQSQGPRGRNPSFLFHSTKRKIPYMRKIATVASFPRGQGQELKWDCPSMPGRRQIAHSQFIRIRAMTTAGQCGRSPMQKEENRVWSFQRLAGHFRGMHSAAEASTIPSEQNQVKTAKVRVMSFRRPRARDLHEGRLALVLKMQSSQNLGLGLVVPARSIPMLMTNSQDALILAGKLLDPDGHSLGPGA